MKIDIKQRTIDSLQAEMDAIKATIKPVENPDFTALIETLKQDAVNHIDEYIEYGNDYIGLYPPALTVVYGDDVYYKIADIRSIQDVINSLKG